MNKRNLADQFEISDITDNLLVLRDGTRVMVLETTSINLELKSEAEADVLISHYQRLVQALSAPIQILVKTQAVDMDEQFADLDRRIVHATNEQQRQLLDDYRQFLGRLVNGRRMVTRRFYIAFGVKPKGGSTQAVAQLQIQKEQLIRLLQPLELKAVQLSNIELANLFYTAFQHGKSKLQPLTEEMRQ